MTTSKQSILRDIERTLCLLHGSGSPRYFEVRVPKISGGSRAGCYVNDAEGIAEAALAIRDCERQRAEGVYTTLNPVVASEQSDLRRAHSSTRDDAISHRRWLMIDVDPERPQGVSATASEKAAAKAVCREVFEELKALGFPAPIIADSGNGYHLLYRVAWKNSESVRRRMEFFLKVLHAEFGNPAAKVDTTVYNASRITKVYGTMTRKGADTLERPNRRSRLLHVPNKLECVSSDIWRRLTDDALTPAVSASTTTHRSYSDDELIERISRSAQGSKFDRLMGGDTAGYPSGSEADYALANILAWWGADQNQIVDIMRGCGLSQGREKKYARKDYLSRLAKKAVENRKI